jgi:aspartate/methionine/tyrosine aminotransferase
MALCLLILDECGVACTPGLDFDPLRGGKYIRFSFSGETTVFVFTLQAHCLFFLEEVFFVLINLV